MTTAGPLARVPTQVVAGLAMLLLLGARVEAGETPPDAAAAPDAARAADGHRADSGDGGTTAAAAVAPVKVTPPTAANAGATEAKISESRAPAAPAQVPATVALSPPAKPTAREMHGESLPSTPRVSLSLATASPVLGIEDESELRIVVTGAFASPLHFPRILCSTGRVEDMVREGPTSFSARFLLPASRFPQPAIVVADFSHDSLILRGALAVRLRAAASPAFLTDPGSKVTVKVGDKEFGPVVAPADGNVHVPVVVPPGINFAIARSVNHQGNASQQILDLKIPPAPRALVVAPEKLPAGSATEIAVLAVEPSGRLVDASTITLASTGPRPQPLGSLAPGEARFLVRAPASLQDPTFHLMASLRGQPDVSAEADVVLSSAATAQVLLQPEATRLDGVPLRSLRVFLSSQDAFGNPTDVGEAVVLVDGQPASPQATEDGRVMLLVRPPALLASRETMDVEAVLDNGHAIEHISLDLFKRRVPPDPVQAPRYTLTPRLGFLWNFQQAPGLALLVEAMVSRHPSLTGFAFGATVGYLHSSIFSSNNAGQGDVVLDQLPLLAQARYRRRFNRLGLSVGAGAGMVLGHARLQAFDREIPGYSLAFACEGSTEAALLLHRSQVVFGLRYLAMSLGKLSSGDVIVGNSGGFIIDAGYRIGWR
jgi:hypothetical protein